MQIKIHKDSLSKAIAVIQVDGNIQKKIYSIEEIDEIIDNLESAITKLKDVKYSYAMYGD